MQAVCEIKLSLVGVGGWLGYMKIKPTQPAQLELGLGLGRAWQKKDIEEREKNGERSWT